MEEAARSPLVAWESFYVIVGSSGAALTGLQFVVIALIAESRSLTTARQIDSFGTPTIVHFCAVLLVSAILSAPWHALSRVSLALGAVGLTGVVYGRTSLPYPVSDSLVATHRYICLAPRSLSQFRDVTIP